MKKTLKTLVSVVMLLALLFSFTACKRGEDTDIWNSALYLEDTELGEGSKTVTVEVKALEKTVVFTIHTDKDTVGAALVEHGLIDGDEGAFGMYVKYVNGMLADYDIDQSYWGFYINGEMAMTGVDGTPITEGETYQLVRVK